MVICPSSRNGALRHPPAGQVEREPAEPVQVQVRGARCRPGRTAGSVHGTGPDSAQSTLTVASSQWKSLQVRGRPGPAGAPARPGPGRAPGAGTSASTARRRPVRARRRPCGRRPRCRPGPRPWSPGPPHRTSPPRASSRRTSASAIDRAPPSATGKPTSWASIDSSQPRIAPPAASSVRSACIALPVTSSRAPSPRKSSCAVAPGGLARRTGRTAARSARPEPADQPDAGTDRRERGQQRRRAPRPSIRPQAANSACQRSPSPGANRSTDAAVSAGSRDSVTVRPSGSTCTSGTCSCRQRRPYSLQAERGDRRRRGGQRVERAAQVAAEAGRGQLGGPGRAARASRRPPARAPTSRRRRAGSRRPGRCGRRRSPPRPSSCGSCSSRPRRVGPTGSAWRPSLRRPRPGQARRPSPLRAPLPLLVALVLAQAWRRRARGPAARRCGSRRRTHRAASAAAPGGCGRACRCRSRAARSRPPAP